MGLVNYTFSNKIGNSINLYTKKNHPTVASSNTNCILAGYFC